jgi:hypothetical protein
MRQQPERKRSSQQRKQSITIRKSALQASGRRRITVSDSTKATTFLYVSLWFEFKYLFLTHHSHYFSRSYVGIHSCSSSIPQYLRQVLQRHSSRGMVLVRTRFLPSRCNYAPCLHPSTRIVMYLAICSYHSTQGYLVSSYQWLHCPPTSLHLYCRCSHDRKTIIRRSSSNNRGSLYLVLHSYH